MTNLWPMIRLDLRTVAAGSPLMVAVIAGAIGVFASVGGAMFAMPMAAAVGVVSALNLVEADTTYRLSLLHGVLPVERRTVITAHYLTVGMLLAGSLALVSMAAAFHAWLTGAPVAPQLGAGLVTFGILSMFISAQLPLSVRYGLSASRLLVIAAPAAAGLGVLLVAVIARGPQELVSKMSEWLAWVPWVLAGWS